MTVRCTRTACPWTLAEGDLFCGLCGAPAATCVFEPASAAQGLVFYPDEAHGKERRFTLHNEGRVAVDVRVRTSAGYHVSVSGAPPVGDISTRLPPNDLRRVEVKPRPGRPGPDEFLEVHCSVLPGGSMRIPLIASVRPRWALLNRERRLAIRDGVPADLYPPAGEPGADRWALSVGPLEGAVVIDGFALGDGAEHLQLLAPEGRHLLNGVSDRVALTLAWITVPRKPVDAVIEVLSEQLPIARFPLRVHPQPPVALRARQTAPEGEVFVGVRPQRARFSLSNEGARPAQLVRVQCETPGVALAEIALSATSWDCRGLAGLPRAVEAAYVDGPLPRRRVADPRRPLAPPVAPERVVAFALEISPEAEPADGVLPIELRVTVKLGDATERIPLTLAVPARAIRDLPASAGRVLLDYGTVHTCARLEIDDATAPGVTAGGTVLLDPEAEGGQLKSVYRVRDWAGPVLRYGAHVWEEIPHFVDRTDFDAKLRLGTEARRGLRDRAGALRMVSGAAAASYLLGEALARVAEQSGYRPKAVWLTRPAVFDATADAELAAAVTSLGYAPEDVELRCTEPEAYLCALAADRGFRQALADLHGADARPLLGFVFDFGGGTTDVTLFQVHPSAARRIEVVASHGYRWLGGEALTLAIAAHLFGTIPNNERFPFPTRAGWRLDLLDPNDQPLQRNLAVMRALAERVKCNPDAYFTEGTTVLNEALVDRAGETHAVQIRVEEGDQRSGVLGVVWASIERALDDILERIVRLRAFRLLARSVPQVVAVAGNAGKLWCLERIVRARLADAGAGEVRYHFDKRIAKRGVVEGLAVYGRSATRLGITLRDADPHWWYVQVGTEWLLVQPAGAVRSGPNAPPEAPMLDEPVHVWGALDLFQGQGPQARLTGDAAAALVRTHQVPPGTLEGSLAELSFGFDEAGAPGLWMRAWRYDDPPGPWRWFPARPR